MNTIYITVVNLFPEWILATWFIINAGALVYRIKKDFIFKDVANLKIFFIVCMAGFGFYVKLQFEKLMGINTLTVGNIALSRMFFIILLFGFSRANIKSILTGHNGKWKAFLQRLRFWQPSPSYSTLRPAHSRFLRMPARDE